MDVGSIQALEEAGFASWPAQQTVYDGGWCVRLSPDLPYKRCNSINFLDPGDGAFADERLARHISLFKQHSLVLTLRVTPLMPVTLSSLIQTSAWAPRYGESLVLQRDLSNAPYEQANSFGHLEVFDHVEDMWLDNYRQLALSSTVNMQAIKSTLMSIESSVCFVRLIDDNGAPLAVAVGVVRQGFIGIFGLAVAARARKLGIGYALSANILRWGYKKGAQKAWLQVEKDNKNAIRLYNKLGFKHAYAYAYTSLIDV